MMRLFTALIHGTQTKNFPQTLSPSPPASPSELPPARKSEGEANSPPHHFLVMSLDTFEQRGAMLEVAVPWLDKTLWFVPGEADVETLMKEGVSRGRIWTAKELMDLLAIPDLTKERVAKVAQVKVIFGGTVTDAIADY